LALDFHQKIDLAALRTVNETALDAYIDKHDSRFHPGGQASIVEEDKLRAATAGTNLCSWCKHLNLISAFDFPLDAHRPLVDGKGKHRQISDLRHGCGFCQIVIAALCHHNSQSADVPHDAWLLYVETDYTFDQKNGCFDAGHYFVPRLSLVTGIHHIQVSIENSQRLCRIQRFPNPDDTAAAAEFFLKAREVRPEVNVDLLQEWLRLCDAHGTLCQSKQLCPSPDGSITWMIDTRQRTLVPAFQNGELCTNRYAALSYTWGTPNTLQLKHTSRTRDRLCTPQGLADLWDDIPLTIKDAMLLCEKLSIRYLWVDALCIAQDLDQQSLDGLMGYMSDIYGCSYVTIVSAAGSNSWAGLPGVRPGSRAVNQHIRTVQGMNLGTARKPRYTKLDESIWNSRAWTLQESALSKRLLIFTLDEVLFDCELMSEWCESIHLEHAPSGKIGIERNLIHYKRKPSLHLDPNQPGSVWGLDTLASLLHSYGGRKLTKEEDRLRAFSGVLKALGDLMGTEFFFGLPLKFFDVALLLEILPTSSRVRSGEFPTWSWCGWTGTPFIQEDHVPKKSPHCEFRAVALWYRFNVNLSEERGRATFSAICVSQIPYSQKLVADAKSLELNCPFPMENISLLRKMLVFDGDSVKMQVPWTGKSSTENPEILEYILPDELRALNHYPHCSVRLNKAWRDSQSYELEFVCIARETKGGYRTPIENVYALLLETGRNFISYRKTLCVFNKKGWDVLPSRRRRVYLC
jgi:hypothetical protein